MAVETEFDSVKTRTTLLNRACSSNIANEWEELVTYYEPFVDKVLRSLWFKEPDLSDVKQEVFFKLWNGLHTFDKKTHNVKFRTWFSKLIRNTSVDYLRKHKNDKQEIALEDHELLQKSNESEIDMFIENEWKEYLVDYAMQKVSQSFSGKALEVCRMTLDEEPIEAIAQKLNLKKNTVYILRHRVKTRLVDEIKHCRHKFESA